MKHKYLVTFSYQYVGPGHELQWKSETVVLDFALVDQDSLEKLERLLRESHLSHPRLRRERFAKFNIRSFSKFETAQEKAQETT